MRTRGEALPTIGSNNQVSSGWKNGQTGESAPHAIFQRLEFSAEILPMSGTFFFNGWMAKRPTDFFITIFLPQKTHETTKRDAVPFRAFLFFLWRSICQWLETQPTPPFPFSELRTGGTPPGRGFCVLCRRPRGCSFAVKQPIYCNKTFTYSAETCKKGACFLRQGVNNPDPRRMEDFAMQNQLFEIG
jgi:hypothetical protein